MLKLPKLTMLPFNSDSCPLYIPIWFEYRDGSRIDINQPSLIIEDSKKRFAKLRQLGQRKINQWQKLRQVNPTIAHPVIVFYEKDGH